MLRHVIFIYFILLFSHLGYYFNKRLLTYVKNDNFLQLLDRTIQ